jgi:hypothetical protein
MFIKRAFYFLIKKDLHGVVMDLKKNGYIPEQGRDFRSFLKIVEYSVAEQEMGMIKKDLLKIVGDRGELILVK